MLTDVAFLLVHSPALGPSTWRWLAAALRDAGAQVVVPDLASAAESGDPRRFVAEAVAAADDGDGDDTILVGHSGAGCLLPLIADGVPAGPARIVFVDATVPSCDGTVRVGGDFLDTLRELATRHGRGRLPPWPRWWGDGVMEALVPVDERRAAVVAEAPAVPLAFYEATIAVPSGWCRKRGAYLLLSEPYRDDARAAATLGWPVIERTGTHLDIVNDGAGVATDLLALAARSEG